jgi:hypothetical protein
LIQSVNFLLIPVLIKIGSKIWNCTRMYRGLLLREVIFHSVILLLRPTGLSGFIELLMLRKINLMLRKIKLMLRKINLMLRKINLMLRKIKLMLRKIKLMLRKIKLMLRKIKLMLRKIKLMLRKIKLMLRKIIVCWYHDKSIIFVSSLLCYPFFSTYTEVPQTQKLLWFSDLYLCLEKVKWHIKVFLHFIQVVLLHAQQKFFRTSQKFFSFFIEQDISQQLLTYFV